MDGSGKRKQIVRFEPEEMEVLKAEALINAYPDSARKHELAAELGIDQKRVTVSCHNSRVCVG